MKADHEVRPPVDQGDFDLGVELFPQGERSGNAAKSAAEYEDTVHGYAPFFEIGNIVTGLVAGGMGHIGAGVLGGVTSAGMDLFEVGDTVFVNPNAPS